MTFTHCDFPPIKKQISRGQQWEIESSGMYAKDMQRQEKQDTKETSWFLCCCLEICWFTSILDKDPFQAC